MMARFCDKCGTALGEETRFCGKCGAPVGVEIGSPQAGPSAPAGVPGVRLEDNVAALLAYVLGAVTGILFLVWQPYNRNRFVRFHAFQSILLTVATVVIWVTLGIVQTFVGFVMPLAGVALLGIISSLLGLAFFLLWLFMLYKAYNQEEFKLPIIGNLAQRQARG